MFVSEGLCSHVSKLEKDPQPPSVEQILLTKHYQNSCRLRAAAGGGRTNSSYSESLSPTSASTLGYESSSTQDSSIVYPRKQMMLMTTTTTLMNNNQGGSSSSNASTSGRSFSSPNPQEQMTEVAAHENNCCSTSNAAKALRLLQLTKRRCLSHASSNLIRTWTVPGGTDSTVLPELRSSKQQVREPYERYLLKLLAAASVVTPYAFVVALYYLQSICSRDLKESIGSEDLSGDKKSSTAKKVKLLLRPHSVHMTVLAAVAIAIKCNGEDVRYKNLIQQFAVLCSCTTEALASAESTLLMILLNADVPLVPSHAALSNFTAGVLLSCSVQCSHDLTSGRHCWANLLPGDIRPYAVDGQKPQSLASLCSTSNMSNCGGSSVCNNSSIAPSSGGSCEGDVDCRRSVPSSLDADELEA